MPPFPLASSNIAKLCNCCQEELTEVLLTPLMVENITVFQQRRKKSEEAIFRKMYEIIHIKVNFAM